MLFIKIKHFNILIIILTTFIAQLHTEQPCSITNHPSYGRLGDQLITYAKAKWLAHKYNLKMLYKPFHYSDQFIFDSVEELCTPIKTRLYTSIVYLHDDSISNGESKIITKDGTLYSVSLFCKNRSDNKPLKYSDLLVLEPWTERDANFLLELKNLIKPKKPINTILLPKNCITIAVHVRRAGNFDPAEYQQMWATKFPPDHYYIDQIKFISKLFNDAPLYVYIFTDDSNPIGLLNKYEQEINKKNVIFDCRKEGNHYNKNVLEDLFSMTKFDCLIRPDSSFSIVAQLLGDHAIVTFPTKWTLQENNPIVEKVSVVRDDTLYQKLLKKSGFW